MKKKEKFFEMCLTGKASTWYNICLLTIYPNCSIIRETSRYKEGERMVTKINPLDQIKLNLEACIGKKIKLKANKGRKKIIEAEGVLENTYPKVFVVKLDKSSAVKRMSYTYADILTETVELTVENNRIGSVSM